MACVLICATMGRPVFFCQRRAGKHGKLFRVVKFRTMLDLVDAKGNPLPDEKRLTPVGELLRRTSVDELPELINVLKGDMSLVGPRPLLIEYLDLYTPEQMRRHDVLPGITGWAQIHGRNDIGWEERFALDVWYVDHWNLKLDLEILWRTVVTVVTQRGINAKGHATMPDFEGSSAGDVNSEGRSIDTINA
jgi:sugar transferase EpsL